MLLCSLLGIGIFCRIKGSETVIFWGSLYGCTNGCTDFDFKWVFVVLYLCKSASLNCIHTVLLYISMAKRGYPVTVHYNGRIERIILINFTKWAQ